MSKNKIISVLLIVLLIVFIAAFHTKNDSTSNSSDVNKYTTTILDTFDTVTEVTGYATSEEDFLEQIAPIEDRLYYYNSLYDIYNDYEGINNIKTINDNAGAVPVKVDEEIINLLNLGRDMYELTDGKVNIAMGSVLVIWHEYRENGNDNPEAASLPDMAELKVAAEHTDINNIIIDEENNTVFLSDPDMSIDVGSIAKGYACQKVLEYAKAQGLDNILLSLGGNISCLGTRDDGMGFKVAIQNPDLDSSDVYIEKLEISDGESVVTSGDYQRYYIVDGEKYCHIINPDTLYPSEYYASVSVVSEDSGLADALSTALFNMTLDERVDFVNSLNEVEAMWISKDGEKTYSAHFEEYIIE